MPSVETASWQLTLTTAVALGGFVVNAGIATFNAQRTGAVKRLDHFNNVVRRPVEISLEKIDKCCDDAEDFLRDPNDAPTSLKQISRNFHGARRALERTLQDAQNSDLIPGADWRRLQDDQSDRAAVALDGAQSASQKGDDKLVEEALGLFRGQIQLLRRRVQEKVDNEATKTMKVRLSLW
jgi:hypothetical protein